MDASDGQMHATLTDDDCTYRGSTTAAAVEEGKSAPTFTLPCDTGEAVSLESFRGNPVVLYLYPKDERGTRY